jgi:hypothetical protein
VAPEGGRLGRVGKAGRDQSVVDTLNARETTGGMTASPISEGWEDDDQKTRFFDKKVKAISSLMLCRGWALEEREFAIE